jgi:hypothetical protein
MSNSDSGLLLHTRHAALGERRADCEWCPPTRTGHAPAAGPVGEGLGQPPEDAIEELARQVAQLVLSFDPMIRAHTIDVGRAVMAAVWPVAVQRARAEAADDIEQWAAERGTADQIHGMYEAARVVRGGNGDPE